VKLDWGVFGTDARMIEGLLTGLYGLMTPMNIGC
jgi:hypothetical protein